jgi:RHS repeat-associated protein
LPGGARCPGQRVEAGSGLHRNRMRDDDPTMGRYIQPDPLGLIEGASVYGYGLQSPMKWTDPTGLATNRDPLPPESEYCRNLLRRLENLQRKITKRERDQKFCGLPQNFPGAALRDTMAGHRYLLGRAWRLYSDTYDEWFDRCGGGGGMCVPGGEAQPEPAPSPNPLRGLPLLIFPPLPGGGGQSIMPFDSRDLEAVPI